MNMTHIAAELAVEHWKLLRSCLRNSGDFSPERQKRFESQCRFALDRLEYLTDAMSIKLIAYDHVEYEPNLPVMVVNADDFDHNDGLVVENTLAPTVMHDGRVLVLGKVILREGESSDASGN